MHFVITERKLIRKMWFDVALFLAAPGNKTAEAALCRRAASQRDLLTALNAAGAYKNTSLLSHKRETALDQHCSARRSDFLPAQSNYTID